MTEVVEKTVVRPNTESYTKTRTASGNTSLHNGDPVASKLVELLLDEVYAVASKLLGVDVDTLVEKYKHLNPGMQRMNLGNRIRGAVAKIDKGNEKEINAVIKAFYVLVLCLKLFCKRSYFFCSAVITVKTLH